MKRPAVIAAAVLGIAVFLTWAVHRSVVIDRQLQERYKELYAAINSGDDARAAAAVVPGYQGNPVEQADYLKTFVYPFSEKTRFGVSGDKGWVCPSRRYYFYFIPGGNTVDLERHGGQWYFTGKVHID